MRDDGGATRGPSRRSVVRGLGLGALAPTAVTGASGIIDTHVHFYDPDRPEGSPWPRKGSPHRIRAMPADYLALAGPCGITRAVVIEAVWRPEDHDWAFSLAGKETAIAAIIGRLSEPVETPAFTTRVAALTGHRAFRGLRFEGARIRGCLENRSALRALGAFAERDLVLEVNAGPDHLEAIASLAAALPSLRVIVDHLGGVRIPGGAPPVEWLAAVKALGRQRRVVCKVSGLVEASGAKGGARAPTEVDQYRPTLDAVWDAFGPDRVLFGSNWPVHERAADLRAVVDLARGYATRLGPGERDRFFRDNARRIYAIDPGRRR